jgi:hypothetical protein
MANRIKTRIRIGGEATRDQLGLLLDAGTPLADDCWFIRGSVDAWVQAALGLVDAHPEHLLVFASEQGGSICEPLISLLIDLGLPFHLWQASSESCDLQAYPAGVDLAQGPDSTVEQRIVCQTDRDGHPMVYGTQLRELRRLLVDGKAGLALAYLNKCAPEIPPLPPFRLAE